MFNLSLTEAQQEGLINVAFSAYMLGTINRNTALKSHPALASIFDAFDMVLNNSAK